MKNNNQNDYKTTNFFLALIALFIIFSTLKILRTALVPFVIAYLLYFALQPIDVFFKKIKFPRWLIVIFDLFAIFSLLYILGFFVINSISALISQSSQIQQKIIELLINIDSKYDLNFFNEHNLNLEKLFKSFDFLSFAQSIFDSTISLLGNIALVIIFYIFIHEGHSKIIEAFESRFIFLENQSKNSENNFGQVKEAIFTISQQIQKYALYKFLISLGTGFSFFLVIYLFGIDYAPAFGFIAFIFNFIPTIGSIIATIFPVLYCYFQTESLSTTFIIAIVLILLQNIFGNIIEPKAFGNKLGLNPLAILLSLLIWSYIWGIAGMILAVPLTAIIKIILLNSKNENANFIAKLLSS